MNTVSINYTLKYELDFASEYKFTDCKKCINIKTSRMIKKVYNSGSIGYVIRGKFYSLGKLRKQIKKIQKSKIPF